MKLLLKGAKVFINGKFEESELLIEDGKIVSVGRSIDSDAQVISLDGKYIVPGFADVHVHFREPGFTYKETIASGSAAAARGGYTVVAPMPNLNPAPDSLKNLEQQLKAIREGAKVKVIPYGTITVGQKGSGNLADFAGMADRVIGFSDDGRGVQADELMEEAMECAVRVGKPIVAHCEVEDLLHGGYIHAGSYAREHGHKGICSESEWRQVERDIELVRKTGCQYHVCHVSTKESVDLIRKAKAEGLKVTCETAPHYLVLCEDDLREEGRFKMNPPLRGSDDRAALIAGILDGSVDMIATDHAPHSEEEKSKGLKDSAFGIVGLETAFPVLYTYLVKKGVLTLEKLIDLMSIAPRRVFGLEGGIEAGQPADLAILDLDAKYEINPDVFISMGRATPFAGWSVQGMNVMTLVDGNIVYEQRL